MIREGAEIWTTVPLLVALYLLGLVDSRLRISKQLLSKMISDGLWSSIGLAVAYSTLNIFANNICLFDLNNDMREARALPRLTMTESDEGNPSLAVLSEA